MHSVFFAARCLHKGSYAVVRYLSVCPVSVMFVYCIETSKHILRLLSPSGSHAILVFPYQNLRQYSDGTPLTGASNAGGIVTALS